MHTGSCQVRRLDSKSEQPTLDCHVLAIPTDKNLLNSQPYKLIKSYRNDFCDKIVSYLSAKTDNFCPDNRFRCPAIFFFGRFSSDIISGKCTFFGPKFVRMAICPFQYSDPAVALRLTSILQG